MFYIGKLYISKFYLNNSAVIEIIIKTTIFFLHRIK